MNTYFFCKYAYSETSCDIINIQSDQFLDKMLHFGANTISIQSSWSEFMQEVGRKQSCWNSHFTVDRSGIMCFDPTDCKDLPKPSKQ